MQSADSAGIEKWMKWTIGHWSSKFNWEFSGESTTGDLDQVQLVRLVKTHRAKVKEEQSGKSLHQGATKMMKEYEGYIYIYVYIIYIYIII